MCAWESILNSKHPSMPLVEAVSRWVNTQQILVIVNIYYVVTATYCILAWTPVVCGEQYTAYS